MCKSHSLRVLTQKYTREMKKSSNAVGSHHGDEEAQYQQSETKGVTTDDDFLDGMNVEDWLAKHQENNFRTPMTTSRTSQSLSTTKLPPATTASRLEAGQFLDSGELMEHSSINDGGEDVLHSLSKHHAQNTCESYKPELRDKTLDHTTGSASILPGTTCNMSGHNDEELVAVTTDPSQTKLEGQSATHDEDIMLDTVLLDASSRVVDNNNKQANDFYVAELLPPRDDNILLIEGVVRPVDSRTRRACLAVGFLVLLAIISVVAAKITTWISSSSPASSNTPASTPGDSQEGRESLLGNNTLSSVATHQVLGNSSWTFADAIAASGKQGGIVGWYVSTINGKIYLDMINRTDTNFTIFGISRKVNIFDGEFSSLLIKIVTPLWYGHFVSVS
jgi:hypothetical protein